MLILGKLLNLLKLLFINMNQSQKEKLPFLIVGGLIFIGVLYCLVNSSTGKKKEENTNFPKEIEPTSTAENVAQCHKIISNYEQSTSCLENIIKSQVTDNHKQENGITDLDYEKKSIMILIGEYKFKQAITNDNLLFVKAVVDSSRVKLKRISQQYQINSNCNE